MYKLVKHFVNFGLFYFGKTEPIVGPFKILWFLTYRCNARCIFCDRWKEKSDRREVDTATVKNALSDLANIGSYALSLSGGEPLLRKDIFEIIKHAKLKGFDLINIDTNALLLEHYAEKLIDLGVDTIYVSLDSPEAKKHDYFRGISGCYDKAINGVKKVLELREKTKKNHPKIFFHMVFTGENVGELPLLFELAKDLGIDGVGFAPLHESPESLFQINDNELKIKEEEIEIIKETINFVERKYKRLLAHPIEYNRALVEYLHNPNSIKKYRCIAGYSFIMIDPFGDVFPCDLRIKKLGNIKEMSVEEIWQGDIAKDIRKKIKNNQHPPCCHPCVQSYNVQLHGLNGILSKAPKSILNRIR